MNNENSRRGAKPKKKKNSNKPIVFGEFSNKPRGQHYEKWEPKNIKSLSPRQIYIFLMHRHSNHWKTLCVGGWYNRRSLKNKRYRRIRCIIEIDMWIEMDHEAHAYSFAITFLCMEHERSANLFCTTKRKRISQCIRFWTVGCPLFNRWKRVLIKRHREKMRGNQTNGMECLTWNFL